MICDETICMGHGYADPHQTSPSPPKLPRLKLDALIVPEALLNSLTPFGSRRYALPIETLQNK